MRPRLKIKEELLRVEAFHSLSNWEKASLCSASVGAQPRFALALFAPLGRESGQLAHELVTTSRHAPRSMLGAALFAGQRGAARIWARPAQFQDNLPKASSAAPWPEWADALDSPATDAQIQRMFPWLFPFLCSASGISPHSPVMAASCATLAFARGRPALGLFIAKKLLQYPAPELAKATSSSRWHQCAEISAEQFVKARLASPHSAETPNLAAWDSGLLSAETSNLHEKFVRGDKPRDLSDCSLLSLMRAWAALAEAQSSSAEGSGRKLSAELSAVADDLWHRGAMSSPEEYARRFRQDPPSEISPQIQFISGLPTQERERALSQIWLQACAEPNAACGGGALWDVFVQRHLATGSPIHENPFLPIFEDQTPALWSLIHGGELIELGIERGFDPRPSEMALVEKTAVLHLSRRLDNFRAGLDSRLGRSLRIAGAAVATSASGARLREGSQLGEHTRISLSSLCIAAGAVKAARALAAAGARKPSQPWLALGNNLSLHTEDKQRLAAFFDSYALYESIATPGPSRESSQKRLRI